MNRSSLTVACLLIALTVSCNSKQTVENKQGGKSDDIRPLYEMARNASRIVIESECWAATGKGGTQYQYDQSIEAASKSRIRLEDYRIVSQCLAESTVITTTGFTESTGSVKLYSEDKLLIECVLLSPHYISFARNNHTVMMIYDAETLDLIVVKESKRDKSK